MNLTINNSNSGVDNQTACDSFTWINGVTYTSSTNSPTFTLTNNVGCDSIVTLNLTINNSSSSSETVTACDSYSWNGQSYSQTGTYTFTTQNAIGCDSVVTLNLTINNSSASTDIQVACDSYTWIDGVTYTSSTNSPTFTLTNALGCDSIVTLNLTINNNVSDVTSASVCSSYTWNGQIYSQSGTYTYTGSGICAVTDTLHLVILNNSGFDVQTACDSFTWIDGLTYTSSTNTPTITLTNAAGCDSLVTLVLTINNSNSSTTTITSCDSYSWNGQTYTQSGIYTFDTTTVTGCDSLATLVLTINNSSVSNSTQTACGSYDWNGQTYTQSGTYTYVTSNSVGCDSTATLILTINQIPNATATDNGDGTGTASAGASYQWIDCATNTAITGATQQSYTPDVTGEYSVVVTNANGCSDTSACITINVSSINELDALNILVNPNPSNGVFNLNINELIDGQIIITDATGRLIGNQAINGKTTSIDLTNAVTGIYYFTVQFNQFEKVIRVVKN